MSATQRRPDFQFRAVFNRSSAALTPLLALMVSAVGRGFQSETSFSACSSSAFDNSVAISLTFFFRMEAAADGADHQGKERFQRRGRIFENRQELTRRMG